MIEEIIRQRVELERLRAAVTRSIKIGRVAEVDPAKGYRVDFGKGSNGAPFLSPWLPHPESGGQSQSWVPLSEGQVVGVLAPAGDLRQGVIMRAGFSDENDAPSQDLASNVFKAFGLELSLKDGRLEIVGDFTVRGDVTFFDGRVEHNGVNIGEDHKHRDVTTGSDQTGEPA